MTNIIRNQGNTGEHKVAAIDIVIPDVWVLVQRLDETERDAVLEVWNIANDLRQHILDNGV